MHPHFDGGMLHLLGRWVLLGQTWSSVRTSQAECEQLLGERERERSWKRRALTTLPGVSKCLNYTLAAFNMYI
jgi:hypothetical protein